ncbi:MAG: 5-(carboxyamino)imidazole ribonucleotide mutase [Desulfovibrio sp.]|nr:5-(carboxyamino)imidazole ribonucleotide mutase [Desulfovibrio sp.]
MAEVVIFLGSKSDESKVAPCMQLLKELEISYFVTICSAHRTVQLLEKVIEREEQAGCQVFICAAGMGAHLAGACAARTTHPVIGIPIAGQNLAGLDALLSTVQMPPAYPVATVALDGAKNAAWLCAQILALTREDLRAKIKEQRILMQQEIERQGTELSRKYQV